MHKTEPGDSEQWIRYKGPGPTSHEPVHCVTKPSLRRDSQEGSERAEKDHAVVENGSELVY